MNKKNAFTSKTIWGTIIAAAPVVLGWFGVDLDKTEIASTSAAVTQVVGFAMIIWGRFTAKKPISFTQGGTSAMIVMGLAIGFLSGCASSVEDTVENSLNWTTPTGENLDVSGHKDTTVEGVLITKPDGTTIKMDRYQSVGNAGAIAEAGAAERTNAMMFNLMASILGQKLNDAANAGLTAVGSPVKLDSSSEAVTVPVAEVTTSTTGTTTESVDTVEDTE